MARTAEIKRKTKETEIQAIKDTLVPEEADISVEIQVEEDPAPDAFDQVVSAEEDAAEAPPEAPEE